MQNPRTRLVSLRMTQEEYDRLVDASEDQGARSVSEFARHALLTTAQPGPVPHCCCPKLNAFDDRITKIELDVAQVKDELLCQIPPKTT